MKRKGFGLGLALSLLLHLTLFVAPGWRLPTLEPPLDSLDSAQLDAHLVPAVRGAMAPPSQPAAKPRAPRRAAAQPLQRPAIAEAGEVGAEPAVESAVEPAAQPTTVRAVPPSAEPVAVPVEPPVLEEPPAPALPREGRIRFAVSRGDQGFVIGQAVHRWSHDGKSYVLSSVTETTGIAALLRPARVVQASEGEITAAGLRPRQYRTERNGVAGEAASFDWQAQKLTFSGAREAPLLPGAQDVLSLFYQLGQALPVGPSEVMIATGKKFERYAFAVLGEEKLSMRFGEQRALHLKSVGESGEATEIWLGMELRGLPLKVRYTDRNGESFVQLAEELQFDDNEPPAGGKLPETGR